MRVGILVGGVVVVAVRVMVVVVGMLMRARILVGGVVVVTVGIVSFSEEQCLFATELEYWRVRFGLVGCVIFDPGGGFVVVVVVEEVNDLELEVGHAVRIVWCRVNEELYCRWRLSRKSLEGNISNDGGRTFGMVMWESSLKEVFCSGRSCCLGQVTGPREEVVVVEMVVGMVWREVLTNLVVSMEVVILVLPLVRGWMWEVVVGMTEGVLWWVVEEIFVWGMEGLIRGIVAGSLGLFESSGKNSHTVSYSSSNSFPMRGVFGFDGVLSLISSLVLISTFSSVTFVIVEGSRRSENKGRSLNK